MSTPSLSSGLLHKLPALLVSTRQKLSHKRGRLRTISQSAEYKSALKDFFADRAISYDDNNKMHSDMASRTVQMAKIKPGFSVLDICSGTGLVAFLAGSRVEQGGKVVGVDISREMLDKAKQKVADYKMASILSFIEGDIEEQTFPDASFDTILCSASLPYLTDIQAAFKRWHRWLKPRGALVFNTPQEPYSPLKPLYFSFLEENRIPAVNSGPVIGSAEAATAVLKAAGFSQVEVELEVGPKSTKKIDSAEEYALRSWQGFGKMPLAPKLKKLPEPEVAALQDEFVRLGAAQIRESLDQEGCLTEQLTTLWVVAES